MANEPIGFPDGRIKKPSLSNLKPKLKKHRTGGFDALARKKRNDLGKPPDNTFRQKVDKRPGFKIKGLAHSAW